MNIYVVTTGGYEEYRIVGLFTDEAKADLLADSLPDCNGVHVWEADKLHPQIAAGFKPWQVRIENDEDDEGYELPDFRAELSDMDDADKEAVWDYSDDYLIVHCWAADKRAAINRAYEIRRKWQEKALHE